MKRKRFILIALAAMLALTLFPAVAMAEAGDVLNFKIYLIDKDSYALPDYIVTVDNNVQGIANEHGVLSIDGVYIDEVDTFKLFSKDKEQLGAFNMSYFNGLGTATSVSDEDGGYVLNYSQPNETVYMYMLYDKDSDRAFHPVKASDDPLEPGKKREEPKPTPSPSAKPSAKPSASASPAPTAKPTPDSPNPRLEGYVVDSGMNPMVHAGVILVNDEKGGSLSATTDEQGWFELPGISTGQHSLYVSPEQGDVEDSINFNVISGDAPNIIIKGDDDVEMVIPQSGATMYANFMADDAANDVQILEVSGTPLNPPAPAPTAEPTTEPTTEPTAEPSASSEPTAVITVDPTASPAPVNTNAPQSMVFIIIAVVAAAAAIIIAIIIAKTRKRG